MTEYYETIVRALSCDVLIGIESGEYQGDWYALLSDGEGRLGLLDWGFGSCSGCDEWQAAKGSDDFMQRAEVIRQIAARIRWFDDRAPLKVVKDFIASETPKGEWYGNEEGWASLTTQINAMHDDENAYTLERLWDR